MGTGQVVTIEITESEAGERLDKLAAGRLGDLSRTEIQGLIKEGEVIVNGRPAKPATRVEVGDVVAITLPMRQPHAIEPEEILLDVLYEDGDLVAINKPAGMVVHPAFANTSGTLVNAALWHWPEMALIGGPGRAGIVHRLDKDTSGVIVMAKTAQALAHLQRQFAARSVYKRYLTLVEGVPASRSGIVEAPIGRDPKQRKRMAVVRGGRDATSRYDILETFNESTLLGVVLMTGRTHQIRVHMAWIGHPIVGDRIYGHRKQHIPVKRLFLHAAELHIDSPSADTRLRFEAPLPSELEQVLTQLREGLS